MRNKNCSQEGDEMAKSGVFFATWEDSKKKSFEKQ